MSYSYKESARNHGYKLSLVGFLIAFTCLGFTTLIWSDETKGYIAYFYLVILTVVSIPGLLMLFTGLTQILRGGQFFVSVSSEKIVWDLPAYLGESFQFDLDQIDFVKKSTRTKKSGKIKSKYFLVTKNYKEYKLKKQSNVSVEQVVEALIAYGVELRENQES